MSIKEFRKDDGFDLGTGKAPLVVFDPALKYKKRYDQDHSLPFQKYALRTDEEKTQTLSQRITDKTKAIGKAFSQMTAAQKTAVVVSALTLLAGAAYLMKPSEVKLPLPTLPQEETVELPQMNITDTPSTSSSETNDLSEILDGKQFLVIHDNKPAGDEEAGRLLARIALLDEKDGYTPVEIPSDSPLTKSKDLETLLYSPKGNYITCQSNGKKCFEFGLELNEDQKPSATVLRTFKLGVPKGEYTNIEGVAISKGPSPEIFWSHRGDANKFSDVPYEQQAHLNHVFSAPYSDTATEFEPKTLEKAFHTPFLEQRVELRSRADHIITEDGSHLFVAAADPEETGTTDFDMFSIVHNDKGESLYQIEGDKIEAMYHDAETNTLYLGSDNESAGARVCRVALGAVSDIAHKCATILVGQEYGISGMVEVK